MRSLIVAAIALALAACESSEVQWTRPNGTEQQLRDDRAACAREAQRFAFLDAGRESFDGQARGRSAAFSEGDSYRACMQGRGWRRQRVDPR
jgi:hypothetical protein